MKALFFLASTLSAAQVVCPTIADTWIDVPEFDQMRTGPAQQPGHGADRQLVIRGRQALALLQFDLSAAKGMTVTRAVLRIHREPDPIPLHTIGVSTVSGSGAWSEADAGWMYARADRQPWSYRSSDITDVTFGPGGSLYAYPRVRDVGDGWYEADVAPAIVHALLSGDQYGLLIDDEKGQTQTRHVLSSREGAHPPVLALEGTRGSQTAPGALRKMASNAVPLRPGSAIVRFGGVRPAIRYELRYSEQPIKDFDRATVVPRSSLDPLAPKPNPLATSNSIGNEVTAVVEGLAPGKTYYFAARAFDEAGTPGPVSQLGTYRAYSRTYPNLPSGAGPRPAAASQAAPSVLPELWKIDPRTGAALEAADTNTVWDGTTVRLRGARNEFVAFQVAVQTADKVDATVSKPLFAGNKIPAILKGSAITLYREWFVPDDKKTAEPRPWYPDALLPVTGPFDIRDNGVPGQKVQPVFVDVYIPHDAAPGKHTGAVLVNGREFPIEVEVLPFTLPDKLNFIVDLNCYSGVNGGWNMQRGTPEYRALEVAYHRLAHLNRGNLDVLGYNHDGSTSPDHAPPLTGEGSNTKVTDWSAWDAHFGSILDGSAFRDMPRASVPVPAIYMPFFEAWPGNFRKSYKWDDPTRPRTTQEYQALINKHALTAGPIEDGFTQEYKDRFMTVAAQFAEHIRERGWMNTSYMVYFNDKYYFKRPEQGGRGITWWLMDEPNHRDDVRAISFLADLLQRGLAKYPDVPIKLRTDISRVEWVRDLLAGQIDVDCTSQHLFDKNRFLLDDRRRFGKEFWHYSTTNHPRDTNVSMRAWCWRAWLGGANAIVPWNTVRGAESWNRAEQLTVFYPGTKFGSKEPYASIRLKAFRRGQQDVEYLVLLAQKKGWDREAVTRAVSQVIDFTGQFRQTDEEDAGATDYRKVQDSKLEQLRARVAAALL